MTTILLIAVGVALAPVVGALMIIALYGVVYVFAYVLCALAWFLK